MWISIAYLKLESSYAKYFVWICDIATSNVLQITGNNSIKKSKQIAENETGAYTTSTPSDFCNVEYILAPTKHVSNVKA